MCSSDLVALLYKVTVVPIGVALELVMVFDLGDSSRSEEVWERVCDALSIALCKPLRQTRLAGLEDGGSEAIERTTSGDSRSRHNVLRGTREEFGGRLAFDGSQETKKAETRRTEADRSSC